MSSLKLKDIDNSTLLTEMSKIHVPCIKKQKHKSKFFKAYVFIDSHGHIHMFFLPI